MKAQSYFMQKAWWVAFVLVGVFIFTILTYTNYGVSYSPDGNKTKLNESLDKLNKNKLNFPDLIINVLSYNVTNLTIDVFVQVKNVGEASAENSIANQRFCVFDDFSGGCGERLVNVPPLTAGQSYSFTQAFQGKINNNHTIRVSADWNNTIYESNEQNNVREVSFYL